MATVTIRRPDGTLSTAQATPGVTLSAVIGLTHLDAPCGGHGRCGKCRVVVRGAVSPVGDQERALLSAEGLRAGVRLSCLATVEGDCVVELPQTHAATAIQTEGVMVPFALHPGFAHCGAAIDIGTTTLAARLYAADGTLLAQSAAPNPQRAFGADVITRIERALAGDGPALRQSILAGLNGLLSSLLDTAQVSAAQVEEVVLTGNTTMLYLLTGRDVTCLSRAPFAADELFGRWAGPEEVVLSAAPGARIYLPRCVSAFVGADITCALLASGLCAGENSALLADIGTNGELALWHKGTLRCCSTAAGPVFEGAAISQGMQAGPGAIDRVWWEGETLCCHVLGEEPARGLCGSGLIDAVAALVEVEILDEGGAFADEEDAYPLCGNVFLTQKDVRQVQLAKAAICAGMETLLDTAGLDCGGLTELVIAGGFGSFLNLSSGARMGLFPAELAEKARVVGNGALAGAAMMLLRQGFRGESEDMAQRAETVDLSSNPLFTGHYMDAMAFE